MNPLMHIAFFLFNEVMTCAKARRDFSDEKGPEWGNGRLGFVKTLLNCNQSDSVMLLSVRSCTSILV